jgi:hypothetical protein
MHDIDEIGSLVEFDELLVFEHLEKSETLSSLTSFLFILGRFFCNPSWQQLSQVDPVVQSQFSQRRLRLLNLLRRNRTVVAPPDGTGVPRHRNFRAGCDGS